MRAVTWFLCLAAWAGSARAGSSSDPVPISGGLSFTDALAIAEARTPSLEERTAAVRAARAAAVPAAALPDPKLVMGIDNLPVTGADQFSLDRDFMTMEKIGFMQEVPNAAKRRARADLANAEVGKADAERDIERLKVREGTALAWINRYYLERQAGLLTDLDRENGLLADAVRARLAAGKGMAADAILPKQEAADIADRRDELTREIAKATASLAQWIGHDAGLALKGEPPAFAIDPSNLHGHLHHHPELQIFGPMTAMAAAEVREAEADKRSDWGVEVAYQRRGPAFGDMVSIEFSVDLPLFSRTRQNPRIEAREQALAKVEDEREAMLRDHTAELETGLAEYTAAGHQLARFQKVRIPLAQEKVDLLMADYRAGRVDLGAVIAARRERIETRLREIELEGQQSTLAAKLHFAYGETER